MTPEELAREPNLRALQHARTVRESEPVQALSQFRALASLGSAMAMADIGYMYGKGIGVQANASEEEAWYKRAIAAGSVFGQFALAHLYLRTQRYSEAFAACEMAAASGYAPAMYFLAFMYGQGVGTGRNLDKERVLLQQAMLLGHVWARGRLGGVLMRGRWGAWQRLRGLFLFVSGAIRAGYVASRNPKDERLLGHDVSHPFASLTTMPTANAGQESRSSTIG